MRLYGYWRSSASWRVRIGLALKGLDVEIVPVHLVRDGGEQHGDDHAARNPLHQVPVLEVPSPDAADPRPIHLTQSLAILAWLDATHPEPRLIPEDPFGRARAWQLAEVVNSGIQPLQNLNVLQRLAALGVDEKAWARDAIARGLTALEALVADVESPFLVGATPTIADLCLVPQLYNARRFGIDLSTCPTLTRVEANCEALPAFAAAHPDRQPDAPAA